MQRLDDSVDVVKGTIFLFAPPISSGRRVQQDVGPSLHQYTHLSAAENIATSK